jgi:hypothetical protein
LLSRFWTWTSKKELPSWVKKSELLLVEHAYNPSTQEAENLGYTARFCFKKLSLDFILWIAISCYSRVNHWQDLLSANFRDGWENSVRLKYLNFGTTNIWAIYFVVVGGYLRNSPTST